MYVCMYVCMYGSVHCNHVGVGRESFLMYVCMYVCMYVIVTPWVVGVYQNKCPSARTFIPIFPVSNHGRTILYPD